MKTRSSERAGKTVHEDQDQYEDFLLSRTRTSPVQFVGLLLLGMSLFAAATLIWAIYIWRFLGSKKAIDVGCRGSWLLFLRFPGIP